MVKLVMYGSAENHAWMLQALWSYLLLFTVLFGPFSFTFNRTSLLLLEHQQHMPECVHLSSEFSLPWVDSALLTPSPAQLSQPLESLPHASSCETPGTCH